jgi:amino acid transporter
VLIPLLMFLIGLAAVLALVPVFRRPFDRRTQKRRFELLFGSAILLGYIFGGILVWSFVPSEWPLSFGETLAASVDAKTYGHPIEHYAESILVVMLFACLAGSLISVAVTAMTARIWIRRNRLRTRSIMP